MHTCVGLVGVRPQLVVDANDVLRELSEGAAGRGGGGGEERGGEGRGGVGGVRGEGEWGG